jgi:hypothetical protein
MLKTILGSVAAFLVVFVALGFVLPDAACRDGWKSSAIGRMGACSHHGGVDRTIGGLRFLLSLGAAFAVGFYIHHREHRRPPREHRPTPVNPPQREGAAPSSCPKCGGLIAKYERAGGAQHWECCRRACGWTSKPVFPR